MMFFLGMCFGISGLLAIAGAGTGNLNLLVFAGLGALLSVALAVTVKTMEGSR